MSYLISRQDTIDRINEYIEEYSEIDSNGNHSGKWCAMQEAKMIIENMPSAQPERKTGKWKGGESIYFCGKRHYMPMTCSCCGRSALNEPWKFCPNCGARMEEA